MNNEFMLGRHNTVVPEYIMEVMRQRRFLDEDDTSEDAEILEMSGFVVLPLKVTTVPAFLEEFKTIEYSGVVPA